MELSGGLETDVVKRNEGEQHGDDGTLEDEEQTDEEETEGNETDSEASKSETNLFADWMNELALDAKQAQQEKSRETISNGSAAEESDAADGQFERDEDEFIDSEKNSGSAAEESDAADGQFERDEDEFIDSEKNSGLASSDEFDRSASEDDIKMKDNQLFMFYGSTDPLPRDQCLKLISKRELVSTELPTKIVDERQGSFVYLVSKDCYGCTQDVSTDFLAPWNGKNEEGVTMKGKWNKYPMPEGGLELRQGRHKLPRCPYVSRLVTFLVDATTKNLVSDVLFQYMMLREGVIVPEGKGRKATPSTMLAVRNALSNRTCRLARKELDLKNMGINAKTVANAAVGNKTVHKTGPGPRRGTDPNKLLAMSAQDGNLSCKFGGKGSDGVPGISVVEIFPASCLFFLKSCPTKKSLQNHQDGISSLAMMPPAAAEKLAEVLRSNTTASQTVPGFGSSIQCDTTFDVSHSLVTLCLGILDNVVCSKSGKNKFILLGYMIHSDKRQEHHDHFGKQLLSVFNRVAPGRRIPMFMSDGEIALQQVAQGDPFELAVRLLCDIHHKSNLLVRFPKKSAGETYSTLLFGKKQTVDDVSVFYKGLYGALTRREFDELFVKLEDSAPELARWLKNRRVDLFASHALGSKLLGGVFAQFSTSNIVENYNNQLKLDIQSKVPAEELVDHFRNIHKRELDQLMSAVVGGSKDWRLAEHCQNYFRAKADWERMSEEKKILHLQTVGLPNASDKFRVIEEKIPDWILEGPTSLKNSLLEKISHLAVFPEVLDGKNIFIVMSKESDTGLSVIREGTPKLWTCSRLDCKNKTTDKPCVHIIAVILTLPDRQNECFEALETKFKSCTAKNTVQAAIHKSDGGKFKRKGLELSKNNQPRKFDAVSSSSVFDLYGKETRSPRHKKKKLRNNVSDESDSDNVAIRSSRSRALFPPKLYSPG